MDFCPQYLFLKLVPDLGGADDVKSALARSLALRLAVPFQLSAAQ